jgi:hypothetical protein
MDKTKWNEVSIAVVNVNGMVKPYDICDTIKNLNIDKCLYEIRVGSITIKYGETADSNKYTYGDRIYRQIGHLSSWGAGTIYGPNGDEMNDYNAKFKEIYGYDIDHKDITIVIYSFDNYTWRTTDPVKELRAAESYLISRYEAQHGIKPIGNKRDEVIYVHQTAPLASVVSEMFEFGE